MNIIWLGHGSFRIEIDNQVVLIDPWLTGNPMLDAAHHEKAIEGATQILVTHGHFDHTQDIADVAKRTNAPVAGMVELMGWLEGQGVENTTGFNKGGTIRAGNVAITMVPASHSSSVEGDKGLIYTGMETGFMIAGEGHTIYHSGDTAIMADMDWMGDYHKPDIGIPPQAGISPWIWRRRPMPRNAILTSIRLFPATTAHSMRWSNRRRCWSMACPASMWWSRR